MCVFVCIACNVCLCPIAAQRSQRSSQFTCILEQSQCRGCWGGRLCSRRARNPQWEPPHTLAYTSITIHMCIHVSMCCSYTFTYLLYRSRWAINAVCRAQIGPQRLLNLQNISVPYALPLWLCLHFFPLLLFTLCLLSHFCICTEIILFCFGWKQI